MDGDKNAMKGTALSCTRRFFIVIPKQKSPRRKSRAGNVPAENAMVANIASDFSGRTIPFRFSESRERPQRQEGGRLSEAYQSRLRI